MWPVMRTQPSSTPNKCAAMEFNRRTLKIFIACQALAIFILLYSQTPTTNKAEQDPGIVNVLRDIDNQACNCNSETGQVVNMTRITCDTLDYTDNVAVMSDSKLQEYTFSTLMQHDAPPFLSNYKNPCWMADPQTNTLRCLPGILVAGFTKCGTSELYRNLLLHPDIVEAKLKEILYWSKNAHSKTFSNYVGHFDVARSSISHSCVNESGKIYHQQLTLDSSPGTAFDFGAFGHHPANKGLLDPQLTVPQVVHKLLPKTKIVITLRNPVTRLYSEFLFFHARSESSHVNPEDFTDYAKKSIQLYKSCFQRHSARACAYSRDLTTGETKLRTYVGFYDIYLKDWLSVIPREQIYVMRLEDYSVDKIGEMKKLFQFLELGDAPADVYAEILGAGIQNARRAHAQEVGDMQILARKALQEFYAPHNHALAELLGDEKFTWGY